MEVCAIADGQCFSLWPFWKMCIFKTKSHIHNTNHSWVQTQSTASIQTRQTYALGARCWTTVKNGKCTARGTATHSLWGKEVGTKGIREKQNPESKKPKEEPNESEHMMTKFLFKPNIICFYNSWTYNDIGTKSGLDLRSRSGEQKFQFSRF